MSKVTIEKSKISVNSLMNELNALVKERENFEKEEFARSNKRLYEILTKVYRAYVEAKQTDSILKETVREMKLALQKSGERIQTNTLAINLFVRYVFRISRQRTHTTTAEHYKPPMRNQSSLKTWLSLLKGLAE